MAPLTETEFVEPPPTPPSPSRGEGEIKKSRVLAVGDSLETDIPGAAHFGIDSVLVTGGILKNNTREEIEAMCRRLKLAHNYIIPALAW